MAKKKAIKKVAYKKAIKTVSKKVAKKVSKKKKPDTDILRWMGTENTGPEIE